MKRLYLTLLLSCVLEAACRSYTFAVDPAFPSPDDAQIRQAAETWNGLTVEDRRISFDHDGRWRVLREQPDGGTNGFCHRRERIVQIAPTLCCEATVYAVALHEFGHAIGLDHTATGVMRVDAVSVDFTEDVMAECRRVEACK